MTITATLSYDSNTRTLVCQGKWNLETLPQLQALLKDVSWPHDGECKIDGSQIDTMDSAGAWLLTEWVQQLNKQGVQTKLVQFSEDQQVLLSLVKVNVEQIPLTVPVIPSEGWLPSIGRTTTIQLFGLIDYLAFLGKLTIEYLRISLNPKHYRWSAFVTTIYRTGFQALPIIALLSFMIGVVITYQMGLQLKNYGANIFIVDLLGLAILREFGPLLTAIMVAGRTGSAFTAQLGMMKLNQEIDALDTMGVTPAELLLLPRIIGLLISLPLLTIWADIWGVFGGMIMANNMLSITWYDFLHRFPNVIPLRALLIGLGKSPIFALVIATIGCYQGMQVEGNADSIGKNTTRSVVLSIFFIIVVDAISSIILSKLKL